MTSYELIVHGRSGKTYGYIIDISPEDVDGLREDGLEIDELCDLVEVVPALMQMLAGGDDD